MISNPLAILALLTGLNLVNYLDRYLIMAVSPRIQESLHLSDAGTGWVTVAFMFGYFATSPVFGWLGDRFRRKGLIAGGIAIWSLATALSGLAPTYWTMIAARVVVGVGEASYATLAPTIIDDIAPEGSKNRWLSIFYVAIPVGSAFGFIVGGQLEHHFGWQSAFYIAGMPGLLLAAATLLIREPDRAREFTAHRTATRRQGSDHAALLRSPQYLFTVLGYVAQTFALGGFSAWAAPFLYRKLCLPLEKATMYFGAITVVTGLLGTVVGGFFGNRGPAEDRTRVHLRVCAWSSAAAAPLALGAIVAPTPGTFLVLLAACELALFISVAPVNAAILHSVPAAHRATAMAVSIFAIHLFGDMVSAPLVGSISDLLGDPRDFCTKAPGLQVALYTLPAAILLSYVAWYYGTRQRPVTHPDTA